MCDRCVLSAAPILQCPDVLEVIVCPTCGASLEGRRWIPARAAHGELIRQAVLGSSQVWPGIERPQLEMVIKPRGETRFLAQVKASGTYRGLAATGSCDIRVKLIKRACSRCSRLAGKYFEGTIQLRGHEHPPLESEMIAAEDMSLQMAEAGYQKGDPFSFIQDIRRVRGGVDLVVGSTHLGRQISKALQQRFGGRISETAKLVGARDGKDIYRTTFLIRLPRLRNGDVLLSKGRTLVVEGFDLKRTIAKSLDTAARVYLTEDEAEEAEVLGNRSDSERCLVISVDSFAVEIMVPSTYQTVIATRPAGLNLNPGTEVEVLNTSKGYLVIG